MKKPIRETINNNYIVFYGISFILLTLFLITILLKGLLKEENIKIPPPKISYSQEELEKKTNEIFEKGWTRNLNAYYENVRANLLAKHLGVFKYKIKMGNNLWKHVAKRYEISLDTIVGANPFLRTLEAYLNEEIIVISKKGVLHKVKPRETVESIADLYKIDKEIVWQNNNIENQIIENKYLFIPDVEPINMSDEIREQFALTRIFAYPILNGKNNYSSYMGYRQDPFTHERSHHDGLDIKVAYGEKICAVADGIITFAGENGGLGNAVKIKHSNGYVTLYGHNSKLLVKSGQKVKKGKIIALAGSTGRSTGCHLHFAVWKNSKLIDPKIFFIR
ncbi:MAG: M23 family metallopeptidase [Candidatus Firestonebacteria bacterium]